MRTVRPLVVAVLAVVVLSVPAVVLADGRVALVVGNSTYAHIGRLPNPANDAADVAAALRRLGFEVTTTLDAGLTELNQALRTFTRRSAGANVALVLYAGHRSSRVTSWWASALQKQLPPGRSVSVPSTSVPVRPGLFAAASIRARGERGGWPE